MKRIKKKKEYSGVTMTKVHFSYLVLDHLEYGMTFCRY
jgi:hypothetical protein